MLMNRTEYLETISAIKSEIKSAQYRAVLGANDDVELDISQELKTPYL